MKRKVGGILFLLFIGSIILFFFRKKERPILVRENIAYEFNPTYLVNLKPNFKKQYIRQPVNGGDTIIWRTNNQRFRGKALRNKGKRIIVYGDSNIQARFSHLENTYCAQLASTLNKQTNDTLEVINAGIVGFGPDQSLLRFKEDQQKLKPDLVILHLFADNDFGDNIRNRLLEINEKHILTKAVHTPTIDESFLVNPSNQLWRSVQLIEGKDLYNRIMANFRNPLENMGVTLEKFCYRQLKLYRNKESRLYSITADQYDLDVATNPKSAASLMKIQLMEAILKQFKQVAQQANIELMVLIQPSSMDLCENMTFNHEFLKTNFKDYSPSNLTNELEKICQQNEINYLNLYPIFEQNKPASLYFKFDNHWNDKGQFLAAKTTASFLLQNHKFLFSK